MINPAEARLTIRWHRDQCGWKNSKIHDDDVQKGEIEYFKAPQPVCSLLHKVDLVLDV